MKFKVGQVWADYDGREETIISIDLGSVYPIKTSSCEYDIEGLYKYSNNCSDGNLITLISEPEETTEVPQTEPREEKLLTLQEVAATLTMDQVVGIEGTDWSWYYQWGVVEECEIGLVISVDEKPMPVTFSNLTDRHFIIRDKSSLKGK